DRFPSGQAFVAALAEPGGLHAAPTLAATQAPTLPAVAPRAAQPDAAGTVATTPAPVPPPPPPPARAGVGWWVALTGLAAIVVVLLVTWGWTGSLGSLPGLAVAPTAAPTAAPLLAAPPVVPTVPLTAGLAATVPVTPVAAPSLTQPAAT